MPSIKVAQATAYRTTVAAATMLAVSSVALLLSGGMMAVAAAATFAPRRTVVVVSSAPALTIVRVPRLVALSAQAGYFVIYEGDVLAPMAHELTAKRSRGELTPRAAAEQLAAAKARQTQQRKIFRGKILDAVAKLRGRVDHANLAREVFPAGGEFGDLLFADVADISTDEAAQLVAVPGVARVVPNTARHALVRESVPVISAPAVWAMDNQGRPCGASGQPCLTGQGVAVAVVDTGVDYTRPAFGSCTREQFLAHQCAKVPQGHDFVRCPSLNSEGRCNVPEVDGDEDPMDGAGHGTHVAGIIAGDDGGLRGVAPGAAVFAYKVLNDSQGAGLDSWITAALTRAVQDGAQVINLSLGGLGNPDDALSRVVDNAVRSGVTVVVSAGNSGPAAQDPDTSCWPPGGNGQVDSICSPGTARLAITVGATYKQAYPTLRIGDDLRPVVDQLVYFSSRGPVVWAPAGANQQLAKPDVVAPGALICAAAAGVNPGPCVHQFPATTDPAHVMKLGTSMAAPHVAGAVALVLQANPGLTPQAVKDALRQAARDNPAVPPESEGAGRIDVAGAVALVRPAEELPPEFRRGDVNGDAVLNLTDPVLLLNALFLDTTIVLPCRDAADSNDDGRLNLTDAIRVLNYLFLDPRQVPPMPGPATPGLDPTTDELDCAVPAR